MLKCIPRCILITPVLTELHLFKKYDRIMFKIVLLKHKTVNITVSEYGSNNLISINDCSPCGSSEPCLLRVPPVSKMCSLRDHFMYTSYVME